MPGSKKNIKCPVCGMDVNEESEFKAGHQGETYYFCSDEDKKEFKKHPSLYIKQQEKAA